MAEGSAQANGFRNPPEGASALGQVGGRSAWVDDASAISHNPANLTEIGEAETVFSLTAIHAETDYTSPAGAGATTEDPWKLLPNFYAAMPLTDERVVAGVGVTTPFGQSTEWSKENPFRYSSPYFAQLRVVDVNPTVAAQINKHFSVGVGLDVFWSDLEFRQVFPWSMATGVPAMPDGDAKVLVDGTGLGANAAVTWKITKYQRLAATYRTSVDVDYDGDYTVRGGPVFPGGDGSVRGDASTDIKFPAVASLGYGLQLTDKVRLGVDVEWVEFSTYERLDLSFDDTTGVMPDAAVQQDWDDVFNYGLGIDWQCAESLVLRAGYMFLRSPVPDKTLAPTLADADRHAFSVGTGYEAGAHRLDLALVLSLHEERDVSDNLNPAYNGTYDNQSTILGASYAYSF